MILNHCDYEGGWTSNGANNFDADPLFVDPANGLYQLTALSPCLDAGDDAVAPSADIDGNLRVDVAGAGIPGVASDVGCFEYHP